MSENKQTDQEVKIEQPVKDKRPDDYSGLNIEAKFKIFDPETEETFVEGRA